MKTRKQHLQDMVESLERELIIQEIDILYLKSLDDEQVVRKIPTPYGVEKQRKKEAIEQSEANQAKQRKILEIAKELLAKEEAAQTEKV